MSYTLVHVTRGTKLLYHIKVLLNALDGNRNVFETYPFEAFPRDFVEAEFNTQEFPIGFQKFTKLLKALESHDKEMATKYKNGASLLMFKTTNPRLPLAFIGTVFKELVHDLRFMHVFTRKYYEDYFKNVETDMGINEMPSNITEVYVGFMKNICKGLMLRFEFIFCLLVKGFTYRTTNVEAIMQVLIQIAFSAKDIVNSMIAEFGAPMSNMNAMDPNFKQLYIRNDVYDKNKSTAWHIRHKLNRPDINCICTVEEYNGDYMITGPKHTSSNTDKPDINADKPRRRLFEHVALMFDQTLPDKIEADGTVKEWTWKLPV